MRAERLAVGDPRKSLEERYGTHNRYVRKVRRAAERLVDQRLLLREDAERYIEADVDADIGLPRGKPRDDDDDDDDDD